MKTYLVLVLAVLAFFRASAQVTVELGLEQEQFLPSEPVVVAVKITNRSGQQLHLGADANWLTFNVEAADGFVVIKNAEVPVVGEYDVESSQMATKRWNLTPYFQMSKTGRYKITATVRIKEWAKAISTLPKQFDVINGAQLWTQDFGVPAGTNAVPEVRKYTLEQANYLREQLRLYVRVSDASGAFVFRVQALGALVSFGQPQAVVDRTSRLHVAWQAGAQAFNYCIVSPDGEVVRREVYDYFNGSRPHLTVNENGEVVMSGGVRRAKATDLPVVNPPAELPVPVPAAATRP